jgi:hypothetical protein
MPWWSWILNPFTGLAGIVIGIVIQELVKERGEARFLDDAERAEKARHVEPNGPHR